MEAVYKRRLFANVMKKLAPLTLLVMPALIHPMMLLAQTQTGSVTNHPPGATPLKFDVATIRRCRPSLPVAGEGRGGAGGGTASGDGVFPGRLRISCLSVSALILLAYRTDPPINSGGISDTRPIRGGPAWAYSDLYTIEAKTDNPALRATGPESIAPSKLLMGPMLQSLIAERFQLKIHGETEQTAMYALTVIKGRLKLKPLEKGDCTPRDQRDSAKSVLANATGSKPLCGAIYVGPDGPNLRIAAGGATLSTFAGILSGFVMDRHVIDRTGVKGMFNIDITFAKDENTPARSDPFGSSVTDASGIPLRESIFTALTEQLGLRLQKIRAPRGYFVVDHVERPSDN
jgi:uncharacterized protein (TIGR03435 family)